MDRGLKSGWREVLLMLMTVAIGMGSCTHDPFPASAPPIEVNPGNDYGGQVPDCVYEGVCFESSVLPIFISSCASPGCHDAASHKEGYNLTNYTSIIREGIVPGNANESKLYRVTSGGEDRMPPSPYPQLTQAQRDTLAKWINEGAKNTTKCNCSCDTTQFAFASTIKPIIDNYCLGCHSTSSPGGGIDLSSYTNVKTVATNGRLVGSVKQSPGFSAMPKGSKLSECQIKQIEKWVSAGALNN